MSKILIKNLVKNSIEAMQCAVELHNKPSLSYRYQTVSILFCNSRELLLKAYILKDGLGDEECIKDRELGLDKSMNIVDTKKGNEFALAYMSIETLREYRNDCVHFIGGDLDQDILGVLLRNIECYIEFLQDEFGEKLFPSGMFYILPIGIPNVTEFSGIEPLLIEQRESFRQYIQNQNDKLQKIGITDSVTIQINVELVNQKRSSDQNLKISTHAEGVVTTIQKTSYLEGSVQVLDQGAAHTINVDDNLEAIEKLYPLSQTVLGEKLYENMYNIYKYKWYEIIKKIPETQEYVYNRYQNLNKEGKPIKFYTEKAYLFCENYIKTECPLKKK